MVIRNRLALLGSLAVCACSPTEQGSSVKHLFSEEQANNSVLLVGAPCAEPEKASNGGELTISEGDRKYLGLVGKKSTCGKEYDRYGRVLRDLLDLNQRATFSNLNLMDDVFSTAFAHRSVVRQFRVPPRDRVSGELPIEDGVGHILRETRSAASKVSNDGTFVWYFTGHSTPNFFAINNQRMNMRQVARAISSGAGRKLKRLVVILETCYAGRVVNEPDPASENLSEEEVSAFNSGLTALVEEEIAAELGAGGRKVELIVLAASNNTSFSYFTSEGGFFTRTLKAVTDSMRRRGGQYSIRQWIQSILNNTVLLAGRNGYYQDPKAKILPDHVVDESIFSFASSGEEPIPPNPPRPPVPTPPAPTPPSVGHLCQCWTEFIGQQDYCQLRIISTGQAIGYPTSKTGYGPNGEIIRYACDSQFCGFAYQGHISQTCRDLVMYEVSN